MPDNCQHAIIEYGRAYLLASRITLQYESQFDGSDLASVLEASNNLEMCYLHGAFLYVN